MIKLKSLLIKEESQRILIPRNLEKREEGLKRIHWRKVLRYIKDGCQGDLLLQGTQLEFLPESLTNVGRDLYLSNSKIKKLPDKLEKIGGSLYLNYTPIEYLPENLIIEENLNLVHSKIKELPNNLKIWQSLSLDYTLIEYLPENLSIGMDLYVHNTPLSQKYTKDEIRKMVKHIGGFIYT
jgi:hypothetical protein